MRILNFEDRNIELSFESPKTIRKWEKLTHKKLIYAVQEAPSIEELGYYLLVGSGGAIKTVDEAIEMFTLFETGYAGLGKEVSEELADTGWLGLAKEQAEDETGKN